MASETLNHLRYHASRLMSLPNSTVRQIGVAMVAEIDAAMERQVTPPIVALDLGETATEAILRELDRRLARAGLGNKAVEDVAAEIAKRIRHMQERRRDPQVCRECGKVKARARGLCLGCYQRARRQGLIS